MNNYPIATILGGGGFIGRYLVRKMTEKNFQCIIPTRNAYLKGYLKTQAPGLLGSTGIKWNFTKFLINRKGEVIKRYAPSTKPEDIEADIKELL